MRDEREEERRRLSPFRGEGGSEHRECTLEIKITRMNERERERERERARRAGADGSFSPRSGAWEISAR